MKIAVNFCYGGFALSNEALEKLSEKAGKKVYPWDLSDYSRDDYYLVSTIEDCEKFGINPNTEFSRIGIVEIPDEITDYMINEYDGSENVIYVLDGKLHWA